jgi:hypothetical protein
MKARLRAYRRSYADRDRAIRRRGHHREAIADLVAG